MTHRVMTMSHDNSKSEPMVAVDFVKDFPTASKQPSRCGFSTRFPPHWPNPSPRPAQQDSGI